MADDPLPKKDDQQPSTSPAPNNQEDQPSSTGCSSCFEQGKTCDSSCVNQSAETNKKVLAVSIARKVKQEPTNINVKAEPIDLKDNHDDFHSTRNDNEDEDDCIIVLDIVRGDKDKPKAVSDEILIISDDEDSVKGDEEPSKNLTTKEKVDTEPVVDLSVSSDIQVEQVETVTDISASQSLLEQSSDRDDPITKAVCEVVNELTDHHPTLSTAMNTNDESDSNIDGVPQPLFPSSPASSEGSDRGIVDSLIDRLGWSPGSPDNVEDTPTVDEAPEGINSTELTDAIAEPDDEAQDAQDGDAPFGNGYDTDGWQVDSEDESNKEEPPSRKDDKDKDTVSNAAKTGENSGKGIEAQQIMERSVLTKQGDINTDPRPVQIIPVDSDLTTRQVNRLVPIGIIPIDSELTTRLEGVADSSVTAGNLSDESEVTTGYPAPMDQDLADSDLTTTQDDCPASTTNNHSLRSRSKNTSKGSIKESIRSEVTRSKLRSSSSLLKPMNENENPSGKHVEKKVSDIVKGNIQPDNPVFNCHLCFYSFRKKSCLEEHLINHPQVTRIMCKYCNTSFKKQGALKGHLKRCYSRKKRKSPRKELQGEPQDSMRIKKEKTNSLRRSEQLSSLKKECRKLDFHSVKKECPSTNTDVASHKSPGTSTSNTKHECKICGKICLSLKGLGVHYKLIHVRNNRSLGNKDQKDTNLKRGMKLKDDFSIWLCPYCHSSFTSRSKVKRHMYLTHNAANTKDAVDKLQTMPKEEAVRLIYYCSTCKESFRSQYMFESHQNTKKSRKRCEKLFQCNLCFIHFDKKVACASHVQEHLDSVESRKGKRHSTSSNEQQLCQKRAKVGDEFKCRFCDKIFEFRYLCAKHECTHTDREPYHCYICFKIFYLDSSIVAHMGKVHKEASYCKKCYCIMTSKEKRLCIDCDKRRVGSGLKCSICKTEFVKPSDLTHHILTHDENDVETTAIKARKASKVSLDPKFQNVSSTSVHPTSNSLKKSQKTTSPVSDIRPVTRSQKESLPIVKPTTRAISHKSSVAHSSKTSPLDSCPLKKRSEALASPKQVFRPVTRSLSDSLPMEETPTTETVRPLKHTRSNYEICMKCGEQDILPKELSKHARTHMDVRSRFQCNTCQQCFGSFYEIEEHGCVGTHQASCSYTVSNVVYQCRFCTRDFLNMIEARKHVLSTNTSCLLECTECKAEYSRQGDLIVHMVSIHGQYLECDTCSALFTRQIDLDSHTRQHEDMNH